MPDLQAPNFPVIDRPIRNYPRHIHGGDWKRHKVKNIQNTLKHFILEEFLPGENPDELTDSTELITRGILDSIATQKLVGFLEEHFHIALQAHELDTENFNTVAAIARLVQSKL